MTSNNLKLIPVILTDEYRKKWNVNQNDFVHLTKDGQILNDDALYRVAGFDINLNKNYFVLLKHIEEFYDDSITTDKDRKPHLGSHWCVIDKNGVEKIVGSTFNSIHTYGIVYGCEYIYYNIETGEEYCKAYHALKSKDFLFLDITYSSNHVKYKDYAVMKININDGSFETFK
jgi:hypothetical protein